jgi:hypothetical protein
LDSYVQAVGIDILEGVLPESKVTLG